MTLILCWGDGLAPVTKCSASAALERSCCLQSIIFFALSQVKTWLRVFLWREGLTLTFKPAEKVLKHKKNPAFPAGKTGLSGAAGRIRTADLILTKGNFEVFFRFIAQKRFLYHTSIVLYYHLSCVIYHTCSQL